MKHWKYLVMILIALMLSAISFGCQSATPRKDLSVTKMEQFFLENQEDFYAVQTLIVPIFEDRSVSQNFRRLRISRLDTDKRNADETSKETLMISTELPMTEADRAALLQAAEPLFDKTPILLIFANDTELYFYYYQEWGYEHFIGYREDGEIPAGSFGNIEGWKQIGENWYAVIAHD